VDNKILDVLRRILHDYGEDMFTSMQRVNAILLDLAPENPKERILVRNFVELGGYQTIKNADDFKLAESKLTQSLTDRFSMHESAAFWVVRVFGALLEKIRPTEVPSLTSGSKEYVVQSTKAIISGQVSIGKNHVVAVSSDGKVFAGGENDYHQSDVAHWRDIVAVAAGDVHTLGLRADGVVFAAGSNIHDECDVSGFHDVAAVFAHGNNSVFVMKNGSAAIVGRSKLNLSEFNEIKSITSYPEGVIGVKKDGTVTIAGYVTDETAIEMQWLLAQNNVADVIATYNDGLIVLTKDGRLLKSGEPENYFAQWRDVTGIANVSNGFAILSSDGTVRVVSYDRTKPRLVTEADKWKGIIAIYGGYRRLIALSGDGNLHVAYTHVGWLMLNPAMSIDYAQNWYPVGVASI